jgi:hypothetical protein
MNYLYHWVPKDMQGDILYPLNALKEKYPEMYDVHKSKYKGREEMMELVIPKINCLWNDALHLSAIHPKIIKDAIALAGGRSDYKMFCYQIDPHSLDPEKTVVYLYSTPDMDMLKEDDFIEFKPDEMNKYSSLPKETKEYYKESFGNKKRPLAFHRAPHILYKSFLNIKDVPIIEV